MYSGRNSCKREHGNILFLILLAVVLFAALSYAVTNSVRGGGKDSTTENMDLLASQIVQTGALLEATVQRAMLMDGIREYGFDLSGGNSNSVTNATCTVENCKLITGNGGKISIPALPDIYRTATTAAYSKANFWNVKIVGVGTDAADLVMVYRFMNNDFCQALQRATQTTDLSFSSMDSRGNDPGYEYSGTMTSIPDSTWIWGDNYSALKGRRSACFRNDGTPQNVFYYVLLAR